MPARLANKKLFLFDVDGVLYAGKERLRLIGGRKIIEKLRKMGKKFFVLTNISTHTRDSIQANLNSLGFDIKRDEILSSIQLLSDYLKKKYGSVKCYMIGEDGFRRELEANGHRIVGDDADFVVVGLDRNLSYAKLDNAVQILRKGAKLMGAHMARLYMYETGPAMAPGPIVKALEYASGKRALSFGKPSPLMFKLALAKAGVAGKDAVMVGDQIETDIVGAKKIGMYTVLTLSGVDTMQSVKSAKVKPDLVLNNVDDLINLL